MSHPLLSGKIYLVVTGASQGIGRQIAISFSQLLGNGSRMLLLARNIHALKEVASKLPQHVKADYKSIDLASATASDLQKLLNDSLGQEASGEFDRAVLVHNVGSIGDVSQETTSMDDMDVWRRYYDLNVFSPAVLNSVFAKIFDNESKVQKLVVNVTSLYAIQPTKSCGYYCTGKAAREMFFKVFALENPKVDVLNYSPGPVQTDMLQTMCDKVGNEEVKSNFRKMQEQKVVLTTEQTVNRLLAILKEKKYKSADHVDYFDEI